MALDAKVQALLTAIAAANLPGLSDLPVDILREQVASRFDKLKLPCKKVGAVTNITIQGSEAEIPVRIYQPEGDGPFPVVIFFHGGGWVLFTLNNYDSIATHLCYEAECVVVSVDYRLAPEHKFPAALVDCYDAVCWTADHIADYGGDAGRIALAGDSAGGNLAAVTAIQLRDRSGPRISGQALLYPATDYYKSDRGSYREFAEGFGLTFADMEWFWNQYLTAPEDALNPLVSPILTTDLRSLPPAFIMVAGNDLLRDEGRAYAERLREAGVAVQLSEYDEMIHGFISYLGILDQAELAIKETARFLSFSD
jgi:acetyl esterase